jgi:LacI family transcriptional regulator
MSVTISDIAKMAKVSKSTVSRVLNNTGYVSEDSRKKVLAVIEELHYIPSAVAQGLSKKNSNTIGVLIPEIKNMFFSEIIDGISEVVHSNSMNMLYCGTDNSEKRQNQAIEMLYRQRVQALIITIANEYILQKDADKLIQKLKYLHVPVVLVDRELKGSPWDFVVFENYKAGYIATKALIEAGNKHIGIITGNMDWPIARERYEGYKQALIDNDIKVNKDYIFKGDFTAITAYELLKKMYNKANIPDALVTSNNQTSIGVIKASNELSIQLGKDLAIVGIDKVHYLEDLGIPFSCVQRDSKAMGSNAMRILLERLQNKRKDKEIYTVKAELVLAGTEYKKT